MDDLLQGVKDMVDKEADAEVPQDSPEDFEMPSLETLMEMIRGLNMTDEQKEQLKQGLSAQKMMSGGQVPPSMGGFAPVYMDSARIYVFVACLIVIIVVFVFFGYKLYRSLTEKERKREEKRKLKQKKKQK